MKWLIRALGRSPAQEIMFLHIGKNAGTQVSFLAAQLAGKGIRIHKLAHSAKLRTLDPQQPYFFSIRDPLSRFRSGFYSRKRKGKPRYGKDWTPFEAQAFANFEHANELAEALFEDSPRGRQALHAISSIKHTSMQQIDWFEGAMDLDLRPPVWILRVEKFEQDLGILLRKLNADIDPGEIEFAKDARDAHRNDYSDTPELTALAIGNLKAWYARDFAFYELCVAWMQRHSDGVEIS